MLDELELATMFVLGSAVIMIAQSQNEAMDDRSPGV